MDKTDLYYQVALEKLQSQEALHAEWSSKAGAVLAAGAALIGIGAIIIGLSPVKTPATSPITIAMSVALGAYVMAAISGFLVLRARDWYHQPTAGELAQYLNYDDGGLTEWVGDGYSQSVECNKTCLNDMAQRLQYAIGFLVVETLAVGVLGLLCCWGL